MSEDLSRFEGERREELRLTGARVGSDVLQRVGQRVLNALPTHASALAGFGYVARQGERLGSRLEQSVALTTARPEVARDKSGARAQAAATFKASKQEHKRVWTLVDASLREAREVVPEETWRRLWAGAQAARPVGASPAALYRNMQALAAVAQASELADALRERGAEDAGAGLITQSHALKADTDAAQLERGTKVESEEIDVLDGLLVEDLRSLRRIARAASAALGNPAIAAAFAIDELN